MRSTLDVRILSSRSNGGKALHENQEWAGLSQLRGVRISLSQPPIGVAPIFASTKRYIQAMKPVRRSGDIRALETALATGLGRLNDQGR